jgi:hypothetical protein
LSNNEQIYSFTVGKHSRIFFLVLDRDENGRFIINPKSRDEALSIAGALHRMELEVISRACDFPFRTKEDRETLHKPSKQFKAKGRKALTLTLEALSNAANRAMDIAAAMKERKWKISK